MNKRNMQKQTNQNEKPASVTNFGANPINDMNIKPSDVLLDLKILLTECYLATLKVENEAISVNFANGQVFRIKVEECA